MSAPQPTRYFYDELSPAAQRLARVPRIARLIARLPLERIQKLGWNASEADVFWEIYNYDTTDDNEDCGLLADGLKTKEARRMAWRHDSDPPRKFRRHQIRRARDLLGAIAFELLAKTDADDKPAPWWNGVADNLDAFKDDVLRRFINAKALITQSGKEEDEGWFDHDWDALLHMNSHGLEHFIFSTHAGDEQLRWTDITTMAFFAAYWACRWATPEELKQTRQWVVDPLKGTKKEFHEFWTMAAEMPEREIDRERWIALFAPLYRKEILDDDEKPIRSTEFIYRSWDRMERWKGEPRCLFLAEFQHIRNGDQGKAKKRVAEAMLAEENLIPLVNSGKLKDFGRFLMGAPEGEAPEFDRLGDEQDNPQHWVTLHHFRLHRFCVSNEEFELFESRHKDHRWDEDPQSREREGGDDKCPGVYVSWYDAACFVRWLNVIEWGHRRYRLVLPSEAQWEYCCRCGETTPFTFDKPGGSGQCRSGDCNFNGQNPFPGNEKDETGEYLGYTLPVGKGTPNLWGFYHMHGNVWEWCADWYSPPAYGPRGSEATDPENIEKASARVLRGGSWFRYDYGGDCRSACRNEGKPSDRSLSAGFRLAAVPALEQGKARR